MRTLAQQPLAVMQAGESRAPRKRRVCLLVDLLPGEMGVTLSGTNNPVKADTPKTNPEKTVVEEAAVVEEGKEVP